MTNNHYTSEVFWSDDDEGYIAVAPDLPGCSAFGETRCEAAQELELAIEAWKIAAQEAGNLIPTPRLRASFEVHSGKVSLRMPKALHADLSSRAREQAVSLNQFMCYLLAKNHYSEIAVTDVLQGLEWKSAAISTGSGRIQVAQFGASTISTINSSNSNTSETNRGFIPFAQIEVQN